MLRNPFGITQRSLREVARQAAQDAGARNRAQRSTESAVRVGANDAVTGEWFAYGRVGITTLGEGFRVRGSGV